MRTNIVKVKIVAVENTHAEAEVAMHQPVPSVKGGW
jgi:hypothetical protein